MVPSYHVLGRPAGVFVVALAMATASVTVEAATPPLSVLLQINRIAGSPSGVAGEPIGPGPALSTLLNRPSGLGVDSGGNLYIADSANNQVERMDPATGDLAIVAANGMLDSSGASLLANPMSVLADRHGNLYIADTGHHAVRFVRMDIGIITTVAGNPGPTAFPPGSNGDGGPATMATLDSPTGLALDADGNLYIVDTGDNRVRKVFASTGTIFTVAGNGIAGYSGDNVAAVTSELNHPDGIALDLAGNLYITDTGNNLIRKVDHSSGLMTTIAGVVGASPGYGGDEGAATQATLHSPVGIAVDFCGQIYFSDRDNNRIRRIDTDGIITTLAGDGMAGLAGDGNLGTLAELDSPTGLALDPEGNLYVADTGNNEVRVISTGLRFPSVRIGSNAPSVHEIFLRANTATTISIPGIAAAEKLPNSDAGATSQEFSVGRMAGCMADGTTLNPANSVCAVPVAFVPRYPGLRTGAMTLMANDSAVSLGLFGMGVGPEATLIPGTVSTILNQASVDHGTALTSPQRIAVDPAGNLYVADRISNVVWRLSNDVGASPTIVAGGGALAAAQASGGAATDALLMQPSAVALDAAGNLYIAEPGANLVRQVNLATRVISIVAGTGDAGNAGDKGPATSAMLNAPTGVATNGDGDLFIADTGNHVIRRVYARGGMIVTVAGTGSRGYSGDGGDATQAQLNDPEGVTLGADGEIFIADSGNNVIRVIDPVTQSIATVAGNGTPGFSGDGGQAVNAQLRKPSDVALDAAGNVYIADAGNARIRKLNGKTGLLETLVGSAQVGGWGDGGPADAAAWMNPVGVAVDSRGQVLVSDPGSDTVRRISDAAPPLNFGSEAVGGLTAPQSVALTNVGNLPLTILQYPAVPVPSDFVLAGDAKACAVESLAVGDQCTISFAFHPTVAGLLMEQGRVLDDSLALPGAGQAVSMSGEGIFSSPVPTETSVVVDPANAVYGSLLNITAQVSDDAGPVRSGMVALAVNGSQTARVALSASGMAKLTLRTAPTGVDTVDATYLATAYDAASSATANFQIVPAPSRTALTTSAIETGGNQGSRLIATVTSSTVGVPTGTVTFMDGSVPLGRAGLDEMGQGVLNGPQLNSGPNVITASYSGDSNFVPSTSDAVTVTAAKQVLSLTVRPALLNIPAAKQGQVTATLIPTSELSDTVTLACTGLLPGVTCEFIPAVVVFTAGSSASQYATLIVDPQTLAVAGIRIPAKAVPFLRLGSLLLAIAMLMLPLVSRRQAARFGLGRMLLVLTCVGLGSVLGCADLKPAAPLTDDITVQASSATHGVLASTHLKVNFAP